MNNIYLRYVYILIFLTNLFANEKIIKIEDINNIVLNNKYDDDILFDSVSIINNILQKNKERKKREVNISFIKQRAPYFINSDLIKGIEYEIVKKVLDNSNIHIHTIKGVKKQNSYSILKNRDFDINIATGLKKQKDEFFYSEDYIAFENVVVSRREDMFQINKIEDLKDKSIISFFNASKNLGYEYKNLVLNKKNTYKEFENQENQVKKFLNKEVDLIILDKNIFLWYLKQLSNTSINEFNYDYIFSGKNAHQIAFKDKYLRDIFNKNLEKIKKSGEYEEIFFNYTKSDIFAKTKVASFLASLLAKDLNDNNIENIKNISNIFSRLNFINKIEVSNQYKVVYQTSNKTFGKYFKQDSYLIISGIPKQVGKIKIYFNETILKMISSSQDLYPEKKHFNDISSFFYLENVFNSFKDTNKKINFSKKEKEFIKNHQKIVYSTLNWEPISILEKGEVKGFLKDYINIIEKKTGLNFVYEKSSSWKDIKNKFKNKKIDLYPNVEKFNSFKPYFATNEISNFSFAIVGLENTSFVDDLNDISHKTLALPKGYPNYFYIKKYYPHLKVLETNTMKEAFSLVNQKKADAIVVFSEVAVSYIKNYFPNLKIIGITKDKFTHNFLINKENESLLRIINKVLNNISHKQKKQIKDKWLDIKVSTSIDYLIIYQMFTGFSLILILIFFFINKLNKAKKQIEIEKKNFETLFVDTKDAIIIAKDGKYIDVNNALLKLFKYDTKEEFLNMEPGSLAPKYQNNKQLSIDLMQKYFTQCYEDLTLRFQWQSKKSTGELFWVDFVMTKLKSSNEDILHLLCRDITENKNLELKLQEQTNLFMALFNGTSDGLSLIEDDCIIDCNDSLLKMYNIKDKKSLYDYHPSLLSEKFQPNGLNSLEEFNKYLNICQKKGFVSFERFVHKTTKEEFWVNLILIKINTNNRDLIYCISRDITNRKKLEDELEKRAFQLQGSNTELENSNNELQKTIQYLKQTQEQLIESEKMASLGGLVAGVAHEINTPIGIGLTGISHLEDCTKLINTKYLNNNMSQEEFEEYLGLSSSLSSLIHTNLHKAASLVKSFKQIAVDQSSEEKRLFYMYTYIHEILESLHTITKKNNLKIEVTCEKNIQINSYAGAYSQVFTNLIMNSIIHAFVNISAPCIQINIYKIKNELIISYKDNGKGIKKENLGKIFEPFYTTNRDNGGSGLGLNIIYNLITSTLNGNIICKSDENEGVEFLMNLKI